jgi:hypothetical protein
MGFSYDKDFLYLDVDVTDDRHSQPAAGSSAWQGDSVQLAFVKAGGSVGTEMLFFRTDDERKAYHSFDLELNVDDMRFDVDRKGQVTGYRIALPLAMLGLKGNPGEIVRFSLIVNENDTGAREGYLRFSDGIGAGKYPSKYGIVILE